MKMQATVTTRGGTAFGVQVTEDPPLSNIVGGTTYTITALDQSGRNALLLAAADIYREATAEERVQMIGTGTADVDPDVVAFLLGEAAAKRHIDPVGACVLARMAKSLTEGSHNFTSGSMAKALPDYDQAMPTYAEWIWGKPVDDRIIARLDAWITDIASRPGDEA